jgi:hypothetical protein
VRAPRSDRFTGEGPNPGGMCMCGCGERTKIATHSQSTYGSVVGTPLRYIHGHQNRTGPYVTDDRGYRRRCHEVGDVVVRRREHQDVWEAANGPVPPSMVIHHVDGNKSNNALSNLVAVTEREHRRTHSPYWKLCSDGWWHQCSDCGTWMQESVFPPQRSRCRPCCAKRTAAYRREKAMFNER